MTASLMPMPKQAFYGLVNGVMSPIVGGKVYTYKAGTLTPKDTYTTAAGTVANPNPVVLDSRGEASVWLGSGAYDIVLKGADDALIWTQDGVRRGSDSSTIDFQQAGTDAVGRTAQAKMREIVSADDFGAVGDGATDDTSAIQSALNASVGKLLLLGTGKTYGITAITIPAGVTMLANGSKFRKLAASSTTGITVQGNFEADTLSLSGPGSSADKGVRVTGSNVHIGRLVCTSDAVDSNYGIHFQSTDATALENIRIDSMKVSNFKSAVLIFYVGLSAFDNIEIQTYVTGVYLRDVYRTTFDGANITLTSPSATGGPGENGLLVESTLGASSSQNLRFSNWSVANAPEHGYRFGGAFTIQDVWLSNCRSTLSGNAGAGATGGCGFKVLGATIVTGQRHRDFFFENCVVEDVNTTGAGQGNFAGFMIFVADNVHISNCSVLPRSNTYSCWHGYSFQDVNDTFLTNSVAKTCRQHGIRLSTGTYASYPGLLGINDSIKVVGGYFDVDAASVSAVLRIDADGATAPGSVDEMTMTGVVFSGGYCAVRAETGITYTKNYFDLEYVNPGNTSGEPPLQIPGDTIRVNYRGLYYGTYAPQASNGSYYLDTTSATMRMRRNGAWVIVSDIDYGTWGPTVTAVTNLDSASLVGVGIYTRMGSVVTVSGVVTLDATATGSVTARVTLPITSAFASLSDCAGVASASDGTFDGTVTADATNDAMQIVCNAAVTSSRNVSFHATYRIL